MKTIVLSLIIFLITANFGFSQDMTISNNDTSITDGFCFGQKTPGISLQIFNPDLISKGYHELGVAISNDGKELFYIMSDRSYTHYALVTIQKNNDALSKPHIPEFARNLSVYTCFFSPEGNNLFFSTNRYIDQNTDTLTESYNWFVKRKGDVWGEPKLISDLFDTKTKDRIHSISKYKNIYLTRNIPDRKNDIYVSCFEDGKFQNPQAIEGPVNSEFGEGRPFISRDESYLIFQSDRPGGFGSNDLWICFKEKDSQWGYPINMGKQINSESSDFGPYVSPDGKYLFFSSYRTFKLSDLINRSYDELIELYSSPLNGYATLYWIDSEIIEKLKLEKLKR